MTEVDMDTNGIAQTVLDLLVSEGYDPKKNGLPCLCTLSDMNAVRPVPVLYGDSVKRPTILIMTR